MPSTPDGSGLEVRTLLVDGMVVLIEHVDWDHQEAVALRAAQAAEIAERYGTDDTEPGTPPSAADIATFVIARDEQGVAVGCGRLRRLDELGGELKRMYVVPDGRGRGVADAVLGALEGFEEAAGWTHLRLETGNRQPDAIAFCQRRGYRPIPCFGPYAADPASLCFERDIRLGRRVSR